MQGGNLAAQHCVADRSIDTLGFYESHGKLSTEAAGHQLIHYHANRRVPPEKLSEFIREGVGVLTLFGS